jgi:hypothetical protein
MRTTLDIAEDVLRAAKEQARREGSSVGQVISELARRGLLASQRSDVAGVAAEEPEAFYGLRPLPSRGVVVTNELINQLRDGDIY